MDRLGDLLEKDVIDIQKNLHLGHIDDVLYDPATEKMCGILVITGDLSPNLRMVPSGEITSYERNHVSIRDKSSLHNHDESGNYKNFQRDMVGRLYMTTRGNPLGILKDIVYDFENNILLGVEISE